MEEISDFFYHFKPDEKILKATFLPTGLSNINYHINGSNGSSGQVSVK